MKNNKVKPGNIFWGLWFIAAAGVVALGIFGQLGGFNVWTLLIGIPMAAWAIASAIKLEWFAMFFQLALLVFIFRRHIEGLLDIRINLWALAGITVLLSIGFHLIFGKGKLFPIYRNDKWCDHGDAESADGERIYFAESFTGAEKYIRSENLSYVSVKNSFGGTEIYFESAKLSPDGCVVDVENSFGGVELYIPHGWNVSEQIVNFMGGTDCPGTRYTEGAPTITIRGRNSFGGVDIVFV